MRLGRHAILIVAGGLATGCSPTAPATDDVQSAVVLVEDLRIGSVDGPAEEQFGDVWGVLADDSGRIYVLDVQAQEVRVFDSQGRFSHVIGSRGEGPGEMTSAAGMSLAPDGRLWVWDVAGLFHVFEPDGTFVESHKRLIRGRIVPWSGGFGADGRLIDWERVGARPIGGRQLVTFHLYRSSTDMKRLDTLPTMSYEWLVTGEEGRPFEYAPNLSMFLDKDVVWFTNADEYEVRRRTVEGDTGSVVLSLPVVAVKVTQEDVEAVLRREAELPEQVRLTADQILPVKPIVRRIFGDGADRIFVVPQLEGVEVGSAVDVFTTDGEYQGRAALPVLMSFPMPRPFATPGHMYIVTKDEYDVPFVVRLAIQTVPK
ncbi:MAG: 6-bladed beta-propeller [Gemmatimonadota bacterium]